MAEPTSKEEYERLYHERTEYFGFGLETGMSVPCPWCCAPGFMRWKILEVEQAMERGATCKECGRAMKGIVTKANGGTSLEMVQTGGPDANLPWLPPMRRV